MDVLCVRVLAGVRPPASTTSIPDASVPDDVLDAGVFDQSLGQPVAVNSMCRIVGDVQGMDNATDRVVIAYSFGMRKVTDPTIADAIAVRRHRIEIVSKCR